MTTGWVPYDGVYPLREEGWLMAPDPTPDELFGGYPDTRSAAEADLAPDKPIDDLEDDAPDVPNDEVPAEVNVTVNVSPAENDDDQEEKEN